MVTVSGNYVGFHDSITGNFNEGKIVFKQKEDIDVFLEAIKNSLIVTGSVTDIGESMQLTFCSNPGTSKTILLWLYPERSYGRIAEENGNGKTYMLTEDNVHIIADLLNNKKH
ncbi:hypothetical protein [Ureibacillus aquaedulcis]|uniref:Uncharacterized protein n=1 Tax=Ureibacillus aquaedulcis TaxID=3058421 RepID=A0ABT8GME3_9BACL|nr:hypothetical protein [Ureibacillus sp. BA0131]MDN4492588.1 hypothetical protein [Ureibacillus sp. BA0131]